MKRLLAVAGLALLLSAAPVAAGLPTVKNPMQSDLDGNHYAITNISGLTVNGSETDIGANYVGTHEVLLSVNPGVLTDPIVTVTAGTADPTTVLLGSALKPGSLYLRQPDATHGELWFKYGPASTDWQCVAGCAP